MKFTKVITVLMLSLVMLFSFAAAEANVTNIPGKYDAEAQGNNGMVKLAVTFSENAITEIKVIEHSETAGLSDTAFDQIPSAIINY